MSELKGKKIAVLLANMYDEREFWYPAIRLREAGAEVVVAGEEAGKEYKSKVGFPSKSEAAWGDLDPAKLDGVVIPGGFGPDFMRRSPACLKLVRQLFEQGKLVAFICHAGWVPVSAGILKGKKVTSFFSIKDDLVNAGAEWLDQSLVRDGNLVSSRNPDDLPDFMRGILDFYRK